MHQLSSKFQEYYTKFIHFPEATGKTCAVVFSTHKMLQSKLGQTIDSFEQVIRFNFAPTIGFEADVGAKTTHRIVQPSLRFREKNEICLTYEQPHPLFVADVRLLFYLNDAALAEKRKYDDFFENYHLISHYLHIISVGFVEKITGKKYELFSTGLWGVFYAVALSKKPTLFGFESPEERVKSTEGHYFNTVEVLEKSPHFLQKTKNLKLIQLSLKGKNKLEEERQIHDFALEKQILIRMHQLGLIYIHDLD